MTWELVNPNEPQPKSDEWSLTFERELKWNWAIWTTGVYARNFDLRRLAEPLRPRSAYSIAITFMYHNFVRVHQTLKTTPAVAAGIAKRKWTVEDMVDLLPVDMPGKRGPYKKRSTEISK